MYLLNIENFERAILEVNKSGFAAIDLSKDLPDHLSEKLYTAMDSNTFHPNRSRYYNELSFYWPEDWSDVEGGIGSFHEERSLEYILPFPEAEALMNEHFGEDQTKTITNFAKQVKKQTVSAHRGLANNELRLSRAILRQMNEGDSTEHLAYEYHKDIGYSDRPYQQLLSVVITTYGIPTIAHRYTPKVGELLFFNAYDRRRLLDLGKEQAFIHKGPKSGPKMFFFFEFLGPKM